MAIDTRDRARVRAIVVAERAALLEKWPEMDPDEVDRRARLKAALKATAQSRGVNTKKAREFIAKRIGRSVDHLKMVLQGNRRLSDVAAIKFVSLFPDLLALEDVLNVQKIPDVVCLHRRDLIPWRKLPRRRAEAA